MRGGLWPSLFSAREIRGSLEAWHRGKRGWRGTRSGATPQHACPADSGTQVGDPCPPKSQSIAVLVPPNFARLTLGWRQWASALRDDGFGCHLAIAKSVDGSMYCREEEKPLRKNPRHLTTSCITSLPLRLAARIPKQERTGTKCRRRAARGKIARLFAAAAGRENSGR